MWWASSVLWSDNGISFVVASKELLTCLHVSKTGTTWLQPSLHIKIRTGSLTPLCAQDHGGSWESLVLSVKRSFHDKIGRRRVTEAVLETTFCLVELALNARPITWFWMKGRSRVSTDSRDLEALTPTTFCLGSTMQTLIYFDTDTIFDIIEGKIVHLL